MKNKKKTYAVFGFILSYGKSNREPKNHIINRVFSLIFSERRALKMREKQRSNKSITYRLGF